MFLCRLARIAVISLASVIPLMAVPGCASKEGEQWTYLVYMHADNNLDGAAFSDMVEMLEVKGELARFVVQVDRHPDYGQHSSGAIPFDEQVQRIVISNKEVVSISTLGEFDSSAQETLRDFIAWGLSEHDNENVALFLWDHGGGWTGYGHDETNGTGAMSLPSIVSATEEALATSPREKFEIIGFDACLMANLSVARSVRHLADYFIASEENEPGHGWDYEAMKIPVKGGGSDAESVGRAIVDGYFDQAKKKGSSADVTLSLVDLQKLDDVSLAVKEAFQAMANIESEELPVEGYGLEKKQELISTVSELGRVRNSSAVFGGTYTHLVDLDSIWQAMSDENPALSDAAENLRTTLSNAVVHKVAGPYHESTQGLSLYLPPTRGHFSPAYSDVAHGGWNNSLDTLYDLGDLLKTEGLAFLSKKLIISELEPAGLNVQGVILGDVDASGFDPLLSVTSTRLELGRPNPDNPGEVLLLGSLIGDFLPESGQAEGSWEGTEAFLRQGENKVPLSVYGLASKSGYSLFSIPVLYAQREDSPPIDPSLGMSSWRMTAPSPPPPSITLHQSMRVVRSAALEQRTAVGTSTLSGHLAQVPESIFRTSFWIQKLAVSPVAKEVKQSFPPNRWRS